VLYTYYVLRGYGLRRPPLRYIKDLLAVTVVVALINSFRHYGVLRESAVIICFPLLAYMAARYDPGWSIIAYIVLMIITFTEVGLMRGPYYAGGQLGSKLQIVTSLYALLASSAVMTSLLSLFMQQRRQVLLQNVQVMEEKAKALEEVLKLKDEVFFVSSQVSHDVRGPISHVLDVCDAIVTGSFDAVDVEEVKYSCETVIDLMDTWLITLHKSGRSDAAQPLTNHGMLGTVLETVDTDAFLNHMSKHCQRAIRASNKRLTTATVAPVIPEGQELRYNAKLLRHVLFNFISNAVKYSDTGAITVSMELQSSGSMMVVTVSDEGVGIPEEHIDHIFERFYQVGGPERAAQGVTSHGVGLNIVKTLVESMCGTVAVQSRCGYGSTFRVTIPCVLVETAQLPQAQEVDLSTIDILLAEDNATCVKHFTRHMKSCHSVLSITDGALVLEELQKLKYDVLLLDGTLPNKTGEEILAEMQQSAATMPAVVTISGGSLSEGRDWLPLAVVHCPKPFSQAKLLAAIRKAVALHRHMHPPV
jgi:signal transduction histidine kinase